MFYLTDSSLSQYIKITLSCSPRSKELFAQMSKCMKSLKKVDNEITENLKHIKKVINNAIDFMPYKFEKSKYTNKACFIIHKYVNFFMKYQSLRFSHLSNIKNTVNEFRKLISDYLKQKVPIQILYCDFLSSIFQTTDESVKKLEFKLQALFNYLKNLPNIEKFHTISNQEMILEMKKSTLEINYTNDYVPQNNFDLIFESYLESNRDLLKKFLQLINIDDARLNNNENKFKFAINNKVNYQNRSTTHLILNNFGFFLNLLFSKTNSNTNNTNSTTKSEFNNNNNNNNNIKKHDNNSNEFDFKNFENLIQKVYHQILSSNEIDQQMLIVLRCAALRFLCNKYYIIHSNKWFEKLNSDYIHNCIKIIHQTPRELKISKDIVPQEFFDTSFQTLLKREDFKNAIKHMFSIQFLICPIDIWCEMQISIEFSMKAVSKLTIPEFYRPNISFDDFFSIILPVFASSQIMSPKALHSFLSYFICIPKSCSLDMTAVSTIALFGFFSDEIH